MTEKHKIKKMVFEANDGTIDELDVEYDDGKPFIIIPKDWPKYKEDALIEHCFPNGYFTMYYNEIKKPVKLWPKAVNSKSNSQEPKPMSIYHTEIKPPKKAQ